MPQPWNLVQMNLHRLSQRQYQVAVIPVGAIEPHNRHLPEGQDFLHTQWIANRCCELAWPNCESVICLPAIPYGVDCNLLDFPLAIHVSQATLDAMVLDIITSLLRHNIRKVVILNGHGGNDFLSLIRQTQSDLDTHLFLCNWWTVGHDRYAEIFDAPDDHGGEFETSVAQLLWPELVDFETAGDGKPRPWLFGAIEKGWVRTSREFRRLNDHCAVGDPAAASPEKGKAYLDIVCTRISEFLTQLAHAKIDKYFPHAP